MTKLVRRLLIAVASLFLVASPGVAHADSGLSAVTSGFCVDFTIGWPYTHIRVCTP
ncbi:MAG TPA: hypothetical protein VK988_07150 [Acidimicrobiales bacterium]|nr:hypothetical protein [Acidimicrobiales bacterium]